MILPEVAPQVQAHKQRTQAQDTDLIESTDIKDADSAKQKIHDHQVEQSSQNIDR
ncbi:hypothetical protein [Ktedonospora formicarum]|uniref:Uncharacterized protein n=1 Tax=Ktedonospora formicarum TaxID=2778364 RepID=A0A8J3I156_9CHLR|nr:hypothetical protein [Ktedonospora formicarum]GHO47414.1 hypothetical protein KSX_55770 [Ktedonospora formicarum]